MSDHHAVIRFKRDVSFPRFGMKRGERWGFVVHRKWATAIENIKAGGRFDFAGGQCLAEDVEIVYEGPGDLNYSIACGNIQVTVEVELDGVVTVKRCPRYWKMGGPVDYAAIRMVFEGLGYAVGSIRVC